MLNKKTVERIMIYSNYTTKRTTKIPLKNILKEKHQIPMKFRAIGTKYNEIEHQDV